MQTLLVAGLKEKQQFILAIVVTLRKAATLFAWVMRPGQEVLHDVVSIFCVCFPLIQRRLKQERLDE